MWRQNCFYKAPKLLIFCLLNPTVKSTLIDQRVQKSWAPSEKQLRSATDVMLGLIPLDQLQPELLLGVLPQDLWRHFSVKPTMPNYFVNEKSAWCTMLRFYHCTLLLTKIYFFAMIGSLICFN